jgi:capsular exopolysaccharide synthesis family protein
VERQENAAPNLHFLEAEVEANKTVYTAFLTRVRQLTAQERLQQPDGRVIDEAVLPAHPYFPNTLLFIGGGFVGSLGIAISLALLMGFVSRGFDTLAQVEKACDAPGLGIVPLVQKRIRRTGMHGQIAAMPRSHYAERLRMIRNSLALIVDSRHEGQVVLLTSSLPEEGKTSCAVSLAASLISAGRKTLLVDADLRRPGIGRILGGNPQHPCLGDLLEGNATIDDVIQVDPRTGLHYVAADRASDTAQDRIDSDVMSDFFVEMRTRYDYVFVDSPPLIAVSDTLWLARMADAVIFLVRWQRTPRSAVRATIQKLRDTGTVITGTLLTFVDIEKSGSLTPSDFDFYLKNISSYYVRQ